MRLITTKITCFVLGLMLFIAPSAAWPTLAVAATLGDRLVIAVNSVPYTQRQLELYLTVKQNIRPDQTIDQQIISAANWTEALAVFTEDMMILQEAMRLGSFAAPDQLLDQYNALIRKKMDRGTKFQQTLRRLGVDNLAISRTLDSILRVASYRQNRNRQEMQATGVKKSSGPKGATSEPSWLAELRGRSNSRVFAGAESFVEIRPEVGSGGAE